MRISFDRAAEYYDKTRVFPPNVMDRVIGILKDELRNCKLILDAGVGTGRFTQPLQRLGLEVVGVDISPKMLQKSVEKKLGNLLLADAIHLPFKDKAFDASISVHMLHLVSQWKKTLNEIVRATKSALFSVLIEDHGTYETTPSHLYEEALKKYGYEHHHPGLGEWDFKRIVKPTKSIFASSFTVHTEEDIACLSEKAFSSQWKLPDNLHEKAMQEIRKIFSSPKTYSNRVYVHKWDIDTITNYLERDTQNKED